MKINGVVYLAFIVFNTCVCSVLVGSVNRRLICSGHV